MNAKWKITCFNCSSRLSESPSNNSTDAALGGTNAHPTGSEWDSDMEVEADYLPDWQSAVPPDKLASLHPEEKKRQDVINGKFIIKYKIYSWKDNIHICVDFHIFIKNGSFS